MKTELNAKQKRFCKLYLSPEYLGNGVQAYIKAYGLSEESKKSYSTAKANASRLLTNANILGHINQQLEKSGLNESFVDQQLLFLITQNADYSSKLGAIKEYNRLKRRTEDNSQESTVMIQLAQVFQSISMENTNRPLVPEENAHYS